MRSFIFSLLFFMAVVPAGASDAETWSAEACCQAVSGIGAPADTAEVPVDTVEVLADTLAAVADTTVYNVYDRRVYRYRKMWNYLIPTQFIVQYAGNMGMISMGMGWDYGNHRQYETNLLFGYLPKFRSSSAKMTMTLKQNFVLWRIPVGHDFHFEPLSFGIYFNTLFGSEFWSKQPKRYPDKYYPFLSTKIRINIFAGQRFTVVVPHNRRKFLKSITAFYEVSTCDIYLRAKVQDGYVSLWDIISLSLGLKFQML